MKLLLQPFVLPFELNNPRVLLDHLTRELSAQVFVVVLRVLDADASSSMFSSRGQVAEYLSTLIASYTYLGG